ncbi:hypothetical protein, partial [Salmonella enterica]|uniref:hypothetical protein n=1 Tax=Salmonella enterica TaxID=28901 RepID=UPI0020A2ECF5
EEELYTTISRFLDPHHEPLTSAITSSVTEPDLSHLYGMANGNQEFIREMVQIFVERNPEDVAELRQASASGNFRDAAA